MARDRGLAGTAGWVPHNGKEEEKFQGVDEKEDEQKNLEPGHGQGGQPAKESIGCNRDTEHFSREGETRAQEAIVGMQNGKSEGDGDRSDRDKKQENQGDFLIRIHT